MNKIELIEQSILLDKLFDIFLDSKVDEQDQLEMKNEQINIDDFVKKNMILFRQLKTKAKAELNQAKHNRVKQFLWDLKKGLESNVESYSNIANEIFSKPQYAELQPMFRNLKNVTNNDKKSILIDAKLLDVLSQIEEEYRKQNNE